MYTKHKHETIVSLHIAFLTKLYIVHYTIYIIQNYKLHLVESSQYIYIFKYIYIFFIVIDSIIYLQSRCQIMDHISI